MYKSEEIIKMWENKQMMEYLIIGKSKHLVVVAVYCLLSIRMSRDFEIILQDFMISVILID
jgi:hypothetical protein